MIHPKIDITPKQAKLGPLIGSTVNWDQLREWCLTPELDQDTDISYAALSYVWGSDPDNGKLKGHMVERLESPNSLDDVPKTIEDALIICSELGYQYLWVDRLCIVQDDFEKKQGQINSMAQIFSSAAVTIVTAACRCRLQIFTSQAHPNIDAFAKKGTRFTHYYTQTSICSQDSP
ncbi:uncharacterized protein K452DRAFT_204684 [Neofusicoccum parvum]|uniref:Uncharacterized protein K452DRAFT_204684, partial n=1 Tax=Neofusicoccum parvum TaxID=310453 RepID=A0ACB5RRG1_9PEZI|nr:uncharacterized protein K452DRAFT_204684 [Neofusicoccum parvum]GME51073.1 uncharacterized protein K452DRAFT_204684 [Neofusicoccum parvum]